MKSEDIIMIKILLVIFFIGTILIWCGLVVRTRVADYDVKLAHYTMDTKYCPYCGEKLR